MKELATHTDPESCGAACKGRVEALTGARAGRVFSRERNILRDADAVGESGRPHLAHRYREMRLESRAVRDPVHVRTHLAREPGGPVVARGRWRRGTRREVQGRTPTMNDHGKSDRPAVPAKSPNNAGQPAAEGMEGRGLAKGNLRQQNAPRTPSRDGAPSALERVRQAARRDRKAAVHGAPAPHLRHRPTADGVSRSEARGRAGRGWRDVAALRRDGGGHTSTTCPNG